MSRSGFTLIETSVVVAVIGLLSAVAIPSFNAARANSLNTTKETNVRLLNNAVELWAMENFLPDNAQIGGGITNYIKGGFDQLSVGSFRVDATNITTKTISHTFAVEDLY